VLRSSNSGNQFVPLMGLLPEVTWEYTALGVKSHQDRRLPDGKLFHRVTEVMVPNLRIVANPFVKRYGRTDSVAWTLPIDDTTTKIFTLYRTPRGERVSRARFMRTSSAAASARRSRLKSPERSSKTTFCPSM
jgi:hypothetical protein